MQSLTPPLFTHVKLQTSCMVENLNVTISLQGKVAKPESRYTLILVTVNMPRFNQVFKVLDKAGSTKKINWYPGHMHAGMKAIIGKLNTVDCVVEVHDARIPFIGRNKEFRDHLGKVKPHLLVLNKQDLADLSRWPAIQQKLKEQGDKNVILTDMSGSSFSFKNRGYNSLLQKMVDLINESDRFNRQTTGSFKVMIVGIPNVGKSTLINRLRQQHVGTKGEPAKVAPEAGLTRHVHNVIRICSRPPIYSLDTPGILEPSATKNPNHAMQLALCSNINDKVLEPTALAQYLLEYLNDNENFAYQHDFQLEKPAYSIEEIVSSLETLSEGAQRVSLTSQTIKNININSFSWHFIKRFRQGTYGKVLFD